MNQTLRSLLVCVAAGAGRWPGPIVPSGVTFAAIFGAALLTTMLPAPSALAGTPLGKTQQLSAPDQVPEGLAKSDWTNIRAAYEAGSPSTSFTLEQTAALAAAASWVSNSGSVSDNGKNKSVTVPTTNSAQFFRLRRP